MVDFGGNDVDLGFLFNSLASHYLSKVINSIHLFIYSSLVSFPRTFSSVKKLGFI